MAAFGYVVRQTIAYVLHPNDFGGTHLSDAVLSRADLGGGILFGWLCVVLGAAVALWARPPRKRQPGLLVLGILLALGGITGVLYSLQGWTQLSHLAWLWDGLGVIIIFPWIGVSFLSSIILLTGITFIIPSLLARRGYPAGASLPRSLPR
jgi:hypothetical protein